MKPIRLTLALTAALGLSACASVDTASRNTPYLAPASQPHQFDVAGGSGTASTVEQAAPYDVARVDVRVPETLKVSEANTYFPRADIVWREDPLGDRHAQVRAIVQAAAETALAPLDTGRPVIVDIQITRFHALTEKTRYTIGGTHDIHFFLTVFDARTGTMLAQPRMVETQFEAYGGARALEAMSRGETQKVRITNHLIQLIRTEMGPHLAPAAPQPLNLSALSSRGI
ncbi:DUF6778 family protein [Actibacterium sp. D379-3]